MPPKSQHYRQAVPLARRNPMAKYARQPKGGQHADRRHASKRQASLRQVIWEEHVCSDP